MSIINNFEQQSCSGMLHVKKGTVKYFEIGTYLHILQRLQCTPHVCLRIEIVHSALMAPSHYLPGIANHGGKRGSFPELAAVVLCCSLFRLYSLYSKSRLIATP